MLLLFLILLIAALAHASCIVVALSLAPAVGAVERIQSFRNTRDRFGAQFLQLFDSLVLYFFSGPKLLFHYSTAARTCTEGIPVVLKNGDGSSSTSGLLSHYAFQLVMQGEIPDSLKPSSSAILPLLTRNLQLIPRTFVEPFNDRLSGSTPTSDA